MTDEAKKVIEDLNRCSINGSDTVIDAADLIEQQEKSIRELTKSNRKLKSRNKKLCDQLIDVRKNVGKLLRKNAALRDVNNNVQQKIERLSSELEQVKRERDQLLSDLVETNNCNLLCPACKHTDHDKDTFPCTECKDEYAAFEWAGCQR